VGLGPLIGAGFAGFLLYLPSHSIGESLTTAIMMFAIIGGLRAADPFLTPIWQQLDRIPRKLRVGAAVVVPVFFSISRFGPSASGHEVSRARTALLVSAFVAFVLLRPAEETE
jgi:hypothetical protein